MLDAVVDHDLQLGLSQILTHVAVGNSLVKHFTKLLVYVQFYAKNLLVLLGPGFYSLSVSVSIYVWGSAKSWNGME